MYALGIEKWAPWRQKGDAAIVACCQATLKLARVLLSPCSLLCLMLFHGSC